MEDSVFTKIINGELPCHKVYEDDDVIAFTPLHMTGKGHILVVPKLQVPYFHELPMDTYQKLMAVTQTLAKGMKASLDALYVGLKIIGTDVPHTHIHLIAFDTASEYSQTPDESIEPDHTALESFAELLRSKLY